MTPRRTYRARKVACLALALATSCSPAVSAAQDPWTEVRSADFILIGHSSPDRLANVACELERVSAALRPLRPPAKPFTTPVVIAADGERDMRELLPQFWEQRGARPVGAYWDGAFGHHIVIRTDAPPRERLRRILHEYAHFVTHARGAEPPKWLDEGLSELWTHAVIGTDGTTLGQPVKAHLSALASDTHWIPVRELTSATELPSPHDAKRLARFYAESWALVHYLVAGRPGGLQNATHLMRDAIPTDEALRAYVRSGRLPTLMLPTLESAGTCNPKPRLLPTSESTLLRMRAMADSPRPDAAEPLLRQLLEAIPNSSAALEVQGLLFFLGNSQIQARKTLDTAIAGGTASHVAYYYRAVLAIGSDRPEDADVPVEGYLRHALELTPDFQPAHARLSELQAGR